MTMDATESIPALPIAQAGRGRVLLSKWVNEKFPAWSEILSAHEVARLTRRCQWVVHTLTILGRFPKRQRFHDRALGWAKHDVLKWLAENAESQQCLGSQRRADVAVVPQLSLPMHFPRTRRGRPRCSKRRKGGKS